MIEIAGLFLIKWVANKSLNLLADHFERTDKEKRAFECALTKATELLSISDRKLLDKVIVGSLKKSYAKKLTEFFKPNGNIDPSDFVEKIKKFHFKEDLVNLDRAIDKLFNNFRIELSNHPDLSTVESIRLSNEIKSAIENLETQLLPNQNLDEIAKTVAECSTLDLKNFKKNKRLISKGYNPFFSIGHDKIDVKDLSYQLKKGDSFLLLGEPGIGKTISCLIISEFLNAQDFFAAIYIPLPEWLSEEKDLFQYCIAKAQFSSIINEGQLKLLSLHGRVAFIFDGWNELSGQNYEKADRRLRTLKRDYQSIGFLISSRNHFSMPTISDRCLHVHNNRLSEDKRDNLIVRTLGVGSQQLLDQLFSNIWLDELSKIPIYLSVILDNYPKELPKNRGSFIKELVLSVEKEPEHKLALESSISGLHKVFLVQLSVDLIRSGNTAISIEKARVSISKTLTELLELGQLSQGHDQTDILKLLTANTTLKQEGDKTFLFQHQLIQEWYLSYYVEKLMTKAIKGDLAASDILFNEVSNYISWHESIFFAVERLAQSDSQDDDVLGFYIQKLLGIAPMLAARLISILSEKKWSNVAIIVCDFAKKYYESGLPDRALAFMAVSGRKEFKDYFWPLIASPDTHVSLKALRIHDDFDPNVLGENSSNKTIGLPTKIKKTILADMAYSGNIKKCYFAADIAIIEPDTEIKAEVVKGLDFYNHIHHALKIIESSSNDIFNYLSDESYLRDKILKRYRTEIKSSLQNRLKACIGTDKKISISFKLYKLGEEVILNEIYSLFETVEFDRKRNQHQYYEQLKFLFEIDNERTSNTIIERLINNRQIGFNWTDFVVSITDTQERKLLKWFLSDPVESAKYCDEKIFLLLKQDSVKNILNIYVSCLLKEYDSKKSRDDSLSKLLSALKDALVSCHPSILLSEILISPKMDEGFIITELLSLIGYDGNIYTPTIDIKEKDLIDSVSKKLDNWIYIIRQGQRKRGRIAEIVLFLGKLPTNKFITKIKSLLEDEIKSYQKCRKILKDRSVNRNEMPPEVYMSYFNLYQAALKNVDSEILFAFIPDYLSVDEFCIYAAQLLRDIYKKRIGFIETNQSWGFSTDFSNLKTIYQKSKTVTTSEPQIETKLIINEIQNRLDTNVKTNLQTTGELAVIASSMDIGGFSHLMLSVYDGIDHFNTKYNILRNLILSGIYISMEIILSFAKDSFHGWVTQKFTPDQSWYTVEFSLVLLACSEEPTHILDIISDIPDNYRFNHRLDSVFSALSNNPFNQGAEVLLELGHRYEQILEKHSWLTALFEEGSLISLNGVTELILDDKKGQSIIKRGSLYHISKTVAQKVKNNDDYKQYLYRIIEAGKLTDHKRKILLSILSDTSCLDIVMEQFDFFMECADKNFQTVERAFLSAISINVPLPEWESSYTTQPVNAKIIKKSLLNYAIADNLNSKLAIKILTSIDVLRDEYGQPVDEPIHPFIESEVQWPLFVSS